MPDPAASPPALTPHHLVEVCPLCGSRTRQKLHQGVVDYITHETFDTARCENCGLAWTEPMPDNLAIGRYYSASYRGDRHAFTDRLRILLRARALARYFAKDFRGRVLDIGCGNGAFALHLQQLGWSVAVTEVHQPTLQRLRERGIDARSPEYAAERDFDQPFDAVTCWHVLEHALDPLELAKWVRGILRPGGIFQLAVPNLSSWQAQLSGRTWLHLDVPRHRYHFTPETLRRLLDQAGLTPLTWSTFVLEYDWFGSIQSPLNALCGRPNVLFERLTALTPQPSSLRDRALSYLLAAPVAGVTLPLVLLSWLARAGQTLDVTCKPMTP